MKNAGKLLVLGMFGFLGAGLLLSGCKSAPELAKADAQAMIQAKYDQAPAAATEITVNLDGMARGVGAGYWARTKLYANNYWADFTLTPAGKKVVKLRDGSDVIKWRPENAGDKSFSVVVETVAASHLKAIDVEDPQNDVNGTKTVTYVENVNLEGAPKDLQIIAAGSGNKLNTKHTANFALDGGVWKLQAIH